MTSEPAATLRTTISIGMISTSLISCSRMLMRRMKCVGIPRPLRRVKMNSEMRLLSTPLPSMISWRAPSPAVVSSLKYWTSVPGFWPLEEILGLALVDFAPTGHGGCPFNSGGKGGSMRAFMRQNAADWQALSPPAVGPRGVGLRPLHAGHACGRCHLAGIVLICRGLPIMSLAEGAAPACGVARWGEHDGPVR